MQKGLLSSEIVCIIHAYVHDIHDSVEFCTKVACVDGNLSGIGSSKKNNSMFQQKLNAKV